MFYDLRPHECPCDIHFVEFMKNGVRNKNIFHFGTGGHHLVGVENSKLDMPNDILGMSLQKDEYIAYIDLITENPMISKNYKVIFSDIYTLSQNLMPKFDIVNLFHLCEYFYKGTDYYKTDDVGLLRLFCQNLKEGGAILFYKGSSKFHITKSILDNFNLLDKIGEYKSLLSYGKKKEKHHE